MEDIRPGRLFDRWVMRRWFLSGGFLQRAFNRIPVERYFVLLLIPNGEARVGGLIVGFGAFVEFSK